MSGGAGEVPDRALSLPHVWRGARNACWYTNSTVILPGLEALEGYEPAPHYDRSTVSFAVLSPGGGVDSGDVIKWQVQRKGLDLEQ